MDKAADTRYSVAAVEEGAHAIQGVAPSWDWEGSGGTDCGQFPRAVEDQHESRVIHGLAERVSGQTWSCFLLPC